jgi:hypothetical protein
MGGQVSKSRSIAYCDDGTTPTIKSTLSGGNSMPDVVILNDQGRLNEHISVIVQKEGSDGCNCY